MSARESAAKYARALLDVAVQESDPLQVERSLAAFADLVSTNTELRKTLTHPAVPAASKKRVVEQLAGRLHAQTPLIKLLQMLAERDRLALLPDLLEVYRDRLLDHQQVVRAELTTAAPMSTEQIAAMRERLTQATGRTVALTVSVEPELIGGAVARIGSTVYDGSVATQLARLREKLLQDM